MKTSLLSCSGRIFFAFYIILDGYAIRHMMALNELTDKNIVKQALYDWYEQKEKNYDSWANRYPVQLSELELQKLETQKAWCNEVAIAATPTLLLNGYFFPSLYHIYDLKYLL